MTASAFLMPTNPQPIPVSMGGTGVTTIAALRELVATTILRASTLSTVSLASSALSNTETSLLGTVSGSTSLGAGSLRIGSVVRITAVGGLNVTVASNLRLRGRAGTATIFDTSPISISLLSNVVWEASITLTVRSIGVNGTAHVQGYFDYGSNRAGTPASNTISLDTTQNQTIGLTALWGALNLGNTITCTNAFIEIIHP